MKFYIYKWSFSSEKKEKESETKINGAKMFHYEQKNRLICLVSEWDRDEFLEKYSRQKWRHLMAT